MDHAKRWIMYRKLLCSVFILTAVLQTSCSMFKGKEIVIKEDPNGSIDEKIAYHQNEIKVYQAAVEREKKKSVDSLQSRNMSEVRRSNDKVLQYERKIKENQRINRRNQIY